MRYTLTKRALHGSEVRQRHITQASVARFLANQEQLRRIQVGGCGARAYVQGRFCYFYSTTDLKNRVPPNADGRKQLLIK